MNSSARRLRFTILRSSWTKSRILLYSETMESLVTNKQTYNEGSISHPGVVATRESSVRRYCLLVPKNYSEFTKRSENDFCTSYVEMSWPPGACLVAHVSLVFGSSRSYNSQVVVMSLSQKLLREHFKVVDTSGRYSFERLVLTPYHTVPTEIWKSFQGTFTSYTADVEFVEVSGLTRNGESTVLRLIPPLKVSPERARVSRQSRRVRFPPNLLKLGDGPIELEIPLIEKEFVGLGNECDYCDIGPKNVVCAERSTIQCDRSQSSTRSSAASSRRRRGKTRAKESAATSESLEKELGGRQVAIAGSRSGEQTETCYESSVAYTYETYELTTAGSNTSTAGYSVKAKQSRVRVKNSAHRKTEYDYGTGQNSETDCTAATHRPRAESSMAEKDSGTSTGKSGDGRKGCCANVRREHADFEVSSSGEHSRSGYETSVEVGYLVRRTNGRMGNEIVDSSTDEEPAGSPLGSKFRENEPKVTVKWSTVKKTLSKVTEKGSTVTEMKSTVTENESKVTERAIPERKAPSVPSDEIHVAKKNGHKPSRQPTKKKGAKGSKRRKTGTKRTSGEHP